MIMIATVRPLPVAVSLNISERARWVACGVTVPPGPGRRRGRGRSATDCHCGERK